MNRGKKNRRLHQGVLQNPRGHEGRSADQADEVSEAVHSGCL